MTWGYYDAGQILLFGGRGPISRFIRFWTCSPFSHCGIISISGGCPLLWESTTLSDVPDLIEGRKIEGVQCTLPWVRVHKYRGRVWIMVPRRKLSRNQSLELTGYLMQQHGKPYDFRELVLEASRVTRWWINLSRGTRDAFFCSELVIAALCHVGILDREEVRPEDWRPADLARKLVRLGLYRRPVLVK